MKIYILVPIFFAVFATSCSKKQEQNATTDSTQVADNKAAKIEEIVITAEQFKNLDVALGDLQQTSMSDEVKVTGMADVPPENTASVSVPIAGFIKNITHNNSLPGKYVTKGTVIATIHSMEFVQIQQDYLQAFAQSSYLKKELERQQTLTAEDAGAKKKLQQAENEVNANNALLKGLEAKLKIVGIESSSLLKNDISPAIYVYAPISGFIKNANVSIGKSVSPGDILFEIISKEHLHLELKVLEKDAFKIQKGQKVLLEDARLGGTLRGTVFLVGQVFEGEAKAINVHVHIDNEAQEQKLIPGMFVNARILTGSRLAQTLPESAILREADGDFIVSLTKQDAKQVSFQKIPVKLGLAQEGNVEVELLEKIVPLGKIVIKNGHFLSGMAGAGDE
jgi:membrane fusion protein, heavy metal efflux system